MTAALDRRTMQRSALAVPLGPTGALVTVRRGARGPWSIVVDAPAGDREPLGPPPGFLALAGIGSCTCVTVAGVASRGESPLHGIRVAFDVKPGAGDRLAISQETTLETTPTEKDRLRLTRAVAHCPVGRDFTKRGVDIDDVVELVEPGADPRPVIEEELRAALPRLSFEVGRVEAVHLPATGEWRDVDGRRILDQEGEVAIHVESGPPERRHRWAFMGGHSSAGWAPRPSSYALAALAGSSFMTLRSMAVALEIDPDSLEVEVDVASPVPAGGKEASQEAAAAGRPDRVRWRRTVRAVGAGRGASADLITAALALDPVVGYCRRGDLLDDDAIVMVPPGRGTP
jgi:uncharacterized OsmC-like protein